MQKPDTGRYAMKLKGPLLAGLPSTCAVVSRSDVISDSS